MDQLTTMRTFVRVAERGSFSAVAREQATTQSQISRQVARLEQRLGAHLFTRTTRSVGLTDEGRLYLDYARRAVAEADEGQAMVRGGARRLQGRLRLATTSGMLRYLLLDALKSLCVAHPNLNIDLVIADAINDLVTDGIDLAIRIGSLHDSGLVARKLAELPRVVVASRAYLEATAGDLPAIVTPEALQHHQCLLFAGLRERRWTFHGEHGAIQVPVSGRVTFSVAEMVREAVFRDLGVGRGPRLHYAEGLASGTLVQLLPGYRIDAVPVHAVYPSSRRHVMRVETLVEHLAQFFAARFQ